MEINSLDLKNELKNKNYDNCIFILHKKVKELLILEVQKYDKDFKYSNLNDLKNKCIGLLNEDLSNIAIDFYMVSITDESPLYELSILVELYEDLTKIKI